MLIFHWKAECVKIQRVSWGFHIGFASWDLVLVSPVGHAPEVAFTFRGVLLHYCRRDLPSLLNWRCEILGLHGRCNLPWKPCLRCRIRWRGIDVAFKDTHMTTVNSHQSLFWRYFPWWSLLVSQLFSWSDAHPPFDSRVCLDCRSARVVKQGVLGSSRVTCFSFRNLLRIRLGSAVHVIRCQRRGKMGVQRKQLLFIFQV